MCLYMRTNYIQKWQFKGNILGQTPHPGGDPLRAADRLFAGRGAQPWKYGREIRGISPRKGPVPG